MDGVTVRTYIKGICGVATSLYLVSSCRAAPPTPPPLPPPDLYKKILPGRILLRISVWRCIFPHIPLRINITYIQKNKGGYIQYKEVLKWPDLKTLKKTKKKLLFGLPGQVLLRLHLLKIYACTCINITLRCTSTDSLKPLSLM